MSIYNMIVYKEIKNIIEPFSRYGLFQASELYLTEAEIMFEIDDARKNNRNTIDSGTHVVEILL